MTGWPPQLEPIGAIRFARRSANFGATVAFYRDLVGLPVCATFADSYGSNGVIFGLPGSGLTLEIFEVIDAPSPARADGGEQLCLYFPDPATRDAATARLTAAGMTPVDSHPYWAATGAHTYRDPDGREVVFAPFVFGANEPQSGAASGTHWSAG